MSSVNPSDPQYVMKHDGVYLLVLLVEPLQDMPGLNDFRANIEVLSVPKYAANLYFSRCSTDLW